NSSTVSWIVKEDGVLIITVDQCPPDYFFDEWANEYVIDLISENLDEIIQNLQPRSA
ncbi:hypothetical protein IH979_02385, partial [Patescibacteria group bacterium]|nr:hypothetical protein [Patescibacteria group bacterium]